MYLILLLILLGGNISPANLGLANPVPHQRFINCPENNYIIIYINNMKQVVGHFNDNLYVKYGSLYLVFIISIMKYLIIKKNLTN